MQYCQGIFYMALSPDYYLFCTTYAPERLYRSSNQIVGIQERKNNDDMTYVIMPNPFSEYLNIKISVVIENKVKISIYSMLMQEVFDEKFTLDNESNLITIKTDQLSTGIYILTLSINEIQYVCKIIKK
jgi:hypothetical protein